MPGSLLSVQAFEQKHRAIPWMYVEKAVHVSAAVDRVPVMNHKMWKGEIKPVGGMNYSNTPVSRHNRENYL